MNLRLPPDVHRELKGYAEHEDRSLTNLILRILREWLAGQRERAA